MERDWRDERDARIAELERQVAELLAKLGHTARKQGKNALQFLSECCEARRDGAPAPSVFAG